MSPLAQKSFPSGVLGTSKRKPSNKIVLAPTAAAHLLELCMLVFCLQRDQLSHPPPKCWQKHSPGPDTFEPLRQQLANTEKATIQTSWRHTGLLCHRQEATRNNCRLKAQASVSAHECKPCVSVIKTDASSHAARKPRVGDG